MITARPFLFGGVSLCSQGGKLRALSHVWSLVLTSYFWTQTGGKSARAGQCGLASLGAWCGHATNVTPCTQPPRHLPPSEHGYIHLLWVQRVKNCSEAFGLLQQAS